MKFFKKHKNIERLKEEISFIELEYLNISRNFRDHLYWKGMDNSLGLLGNLRNDYKKDHDKLKKKEGLENLGNNFFINKLDYFDSAN